MDPELEMMDEPKDYSNYIWIGVFVLFLAMLAAIVVWGGSAEDQTAARVRHILIAFDSTDPAGRARALDRIKELRERIVTGGEDFGDIAEEYSEDPSSRANGGDLGFAPEGVYADNFERYVWTAPPNQVSDVIQTDYGFHLIEVLDRKVSTIDAAIEEEKRRLREELERRTQKNQPSPTTQAPPAEN